MVLELPVPHAPGMAALSGVWVLFAAYALSFVKVGIYWSQHHNMLQAARRVDGRVIDGAAGLHLVGYKHVLVVKKQHTELLGRLARHGGGAIVQQRRPG